MASNSTPPQASARARLAMAIVQLEANARSAPLASPWRGSARFSFIRGSADTNLSIRLDAERLLCLADPALAPHVSERVSGPFVLHRARAARSETAPACLRGFATDARSALRGSADWRDAFFLDAGSFWIGLCGTPTALRVGFVPQRQPDSPRGRFSLAPAERRELLWPRAQLNVAAERLARACLSHATRLRPRWEDDPLLSWIGRAELALAARAELDEAAGPALAARSRPSAL